jgi:type 1 fimbria pilin
MSNFKFQKTILAVSATAAMAGMLVGGQAFAQVKTEQGSIDITAKIITSTCVLNLDSTVSTASNAAKKTLDLGTFSIANASSLAASTQLGKGVSVVLSLKESNGTTAGCAAISTGKWDVQIDMPATAYNTGNLDNSHTFTNTTTGAYSD